MLKTTLTGRSPLDKPTAYARLGYRVLPLNPGEKRPRESLVPRGLKEASRDRATLEAWWRACPECGVGILAPTEPFYTATCPHCGCPVPEDPERHDLGGRIFCPRCGAEWPGEEGGEEVGRD